MSKAIRNNLQQLKNFGEWWIGNIIDSSMVNLKFAKAIVKKFPDAIPDIVQAGIQLTQGDIDDAVNEILDILDHADVIETGLKVSADALKSQANRAKTALKKINEIRKENIEMEKKEKKTNKNATNANRNQRNSNRSESNSNRSNKAGTNHPEWYLKDSTLVKSLVGVNLASRLNAPISDRLGVSIAAGANPIDHKLEIGVPRVAAVQMALTIPKSQTNDWNQAVNYLFQNIRSANAGYPSYSAGQLANYIYSVRSIDALLSNTARVIGVLNSVEFYDAKAPIDYFAAMGLDYDTFIANAANLREAYNRLATIRYRLMPLNITLLDRTRWLFSNVFKDSNDAKSQIYIPTLDKVYIINSDNTPTVVDISDSMSNTKTGQTYADYIASIQKAFNLIQNDNTFQNIADNILKAYGAESLNHYPLVANNYAIEPVYDEYVLMQIQNASLSCTGNVNQNFTVSGDFVVETITESVSATIPSNEAALNPASIADLNSELGNPFINSNVNSLDAGRLLSITRLMTSISAENAPTEGDTGIITYNVYGSEIVEKIKVIIAVEGGANAYHLDSVNIKRYVVTGGTIGGTLQGTIACQLWSYFDYFPYVVPVNVVLLANSPVGGFWRYNPALYDFNNFGIAYKESLSSYCAIATLSLLYKKFVARVNKVEVLD